MKAKMNAGRIGAKRLVVAGLPLCAIFAVGTGAGAQGPGGRRIMPLRSAATSTYPARTGQAANNPMFNGQAAMGQTGSSVGMNSAGFNSNGSSGNSQMPMVAGTILDGEASTGRILIQSARDGNRQMLQIGNATQLVALTPITAASLQEGEQVQI